MSVAAEDTDTDEPKSHPSGLGIGAAQVAAWGFAFLLLRIFAVSGYDWDTAFLVSTTLGLDDGLALLFGSLMANYILTAVLLICVLPLLIAASVWGEPQHRQAMVLLATLGVVALVALTGSYGLWWLPAATLLVIAAILLVRRLPKGNRLRRSVSTILARAGLMAALATLVVAAFVQTPWVPEEKITTAEGTTTAYVLSVDSGYLNVLTADQKFAIILTKDVLARE